MATKPYVVDTNVILVANGAHDDVTEECVIACIHKLNTIKEVGVLVLDDAYRILNEYQNKTTPRKAKGVGDLFVKWALTHHNQSAKVTLVNLTSSGDEEYAEFPDATLSAKFDPPDRKFVAVANAHANRPPILQATDSKWLDWHAPLKVHGIDVHFLCHKEVTHFHKKKFPSKHKAKASARKGE
jgi:hypothetical protein